MTNKIVVTGATGFLGTHVIPVLEKKYGKENVVSLSSKNYDLTDPIQVKKMFDECEPEVLVHLAAYVGGIGANKKLPADYFFVNNLMTSLIFDNAAKKKVSKLIFSSAGCLYSNTTPSPMSENNIWDGYPQEDSAGFAMTKRVALVASTEYKKQYNLNSCNLILGNMYGEFDNFNFLESHVIPATIRKIFEAKQDKKDHITMWGSGKPQRDFIYVKDVAETFPFFIDEYDKDEPINISSGISTSIKELVETTKEILGYKGEVIWDVSKGDGQMLKIFDTTKMNDLGLNCNTSLKKGLEKTIDWFISNYDKKSIRL